MGVLVALCCTFAAAFPHGADAAGGYWPEPLTYESCHGGSGSWQGAIYTQFDARFGRGSSLNAWCRFRNSRGGPGDGFGWGTRANVYEAHTWRSRWDHDPVQGYHYDFSGSYALNYVLTNFGDTQGVDFSNDSTAVVLLGGPYSGSGDHYQCWGEGCHNSFAGLNITNPHFFFHQRNHSPRTYDRYLRNSNHRVWMHDFQGPTIGIRVGDYGMPFQCVDGSWGHNGSAYWCGGRPRFLWASHDNGEATGIGRGGSGLYVDGNVQVATWGNLANGNHHYDSGWGVPGTGSHTFQAYRVDAGYYSWHHGQAHATAWTGNHWVNVDQTPPNPPAGMNSTAASGVWHSTPSITITPISGGDQGSGVNPNNYRIIDNQDSRTVNGPNMVITKEGWHGVWATARDYVGREAGSGPGINVYIDRTPPGKPGLPGVSHASWTNAARVDVSGAAAPNPLPAGVNQNAPIAYQHEYRLCDFSGACGAWSGWAAGNAGYTTAEGRFQYRTRAYDHAGNIGPASDVRNALIDRTAPSAPAVPGLTANRQEPWTNAASVTLTAGSAEDNIGGADQSGIGKYQYRTRHATDPAGSGSEGWSAWSGWVDGDHFAVTAEGHTDVQFRAVDNAGNAGAPGYTRTVRIDRTGPILSEGALGDPAGDWDRGNPGRVTSGEAVDNPGGSGVVAYQHQFVASGDFTNPELAVHNGQTAELLPGRWFIRFRAIDAAGNVGPWGPITVISWIEGPVPPSGTPGDGGAGDDGSPTAPSTLRRSWGADIPEALCHLPSAETRGGVNCPGGGTSWYKGRSD